MIVEGVRGWYANRRGSGDETGVDRRFDGKRRCDTRQNGQGDEESLYDFIHGCEGCRMAFEGKHLDVMDKGCCRSLGLPLLVSARG